MSRLTVVLLASAIVSAVLAGCADPSPADTPIAPIGSPVEVLRHVDDLTARLAPGSGEFFPELFVLDRVDLPAGGNISFAIGLGMRCDGNATGYATAMGWLDCSVRLANDPSAMSRDRRDLAIGFDYQILTVRTATEPIEWRVELAVLDAAGNVTDSFDSGWRAIDLTPIVTAPAVALTVLSPCDLPGNGLEDEVGRRGAAELNVTFTSRLADVNLTFDFVASRPGGQGGASHVVRVDPTEHAALATFPKQANTTAMWIRFPVSLESEASQPGPDQGPCVGAYAHEAQEMTVTLAYLTAEGVPRSFPPAPVVVDIYLAPSDSPV